MSDGSTNYMLSRVRTGLILRTTLRIGSFRERDLQRNRKASCDESPERHFRLLRLSGQAFTANGLGEVESRILELLVQYWDFFAKIQVEEVEKLLP